MLLSFPCYPKHRAQINTPARPQRHKHFLYLSAPKLFITPIKNDRWSGLQPAGQSHGVPTEFEHRSRERTTVRANMSTRRKRLKVETHNGRRNAQRAMRAVRLKYVTKRALNVFTFAFGQRDGLQTNTFAPSDEVGQSGRGRGLRYVSDCACVPPLTTHEREGEQPPDRWSLNTTMPSL